MNELMNLSALGIVTSDAHAPSDRETDEELASRGDAEGFGVLYERHLPAVYRYLSGRLSSREEAEDLSSDVFRQAWTSRRAYQRRGSFRAWIFTIVHRTLADHYRRGRVTSSPAPQAIENILDNQASPEDCFIQDESTRQVRRLLEQLSPQQQEVLRLRFVAELTYSEIAMVIGKREDAVKKMAYRALEVLRGSNTDA